MVHENGLGEVNEQIDMGLVAGPKRGKWKRWAKEGGLKAQSTMVESQLGKRESLLVDTRRMEDGKKKKKMELNTCFNIKTEEEPIETKTSPFEPNNELEEFFQVFEEEVRLFEEEKEGRMKVDIVKEDKIVVEKDINLIMRIDALEKERDKALKVGEELTRIVESQ
ncbi:hypothetical protein LWI28_025414 [Acer negundo]|uniref:Uncharacterized protein n=1 Tax=Acer negundo TaxID=4023 RepID=A0AAD5NM94_ACENE|nr:hypothetical protein LWI28_025414 [Acer negundo]